jgi:hypothetical protein
MRLWSLHPRYLDPKGLVALWREALLAQAVIAGKTRGYKSHPQLTRFLQSPTPRECIAAYLQSVLAEAARRGYRFDGSKVQPHGEVAPLVVTTGQLAYEWAHLADKLRLRAPAWYGQLEAAPAMEAHPLFRVVDGDVAEWEVIASDRAPTGGARRRG